ncbi:MAG: DNA repair protein RecN, partial [Anaerolinea sp.]|nr:DNA repair protein RecN [Anaerolinea sp.]
MLEEIRIKNFAIIDELELAFGKGLNVITGETGAGKSIIIDAVEMLLGGKADTSWVRSGADKALIEGVFALDETTLAFVQPVLEREELVDEGDVITVTREIRSNGRSSARINGVTVNIDILLEIGAYLVDVHGQSAHLSLLKPQYHIDLLDRFTDLMDARSAIGNVVARLNDVRREIKHLLEDEAALQRRADRLRGELEDIEAAALVPGEDEDLKAERVRLSNSESLAKWSAEALALLDGDDSPTGQNGALDQLMQAALLLSKLANIDAAMKEDYDLAEEASALAEELAKSLRRYTDAVEYNPVRLDEVEERLELINGMKRRYGGTIESVLAYAEKAALELDGIENSEERLIELREQEDSMLKHIGELGERISRARTAAAKRLSAEIVTELGDLRMAKAQFEVLIEQIDAADGCYVGDRRVAFDETGIDKVEFMMSANPGEPLRPLAKVASGG